MEKHCVVYFYSAGGYIDQYTRYLSYTYANVLGDMGYQVTRIDLAADEKTLAGNLLKTINSDPKPAFILSIHGYAFDLQTSDGQSIYDCFQIPFLAVSIDNPMVYHGSIKHESRFTFWGLYDRADLDYASKYINPNKNYFFAPNAGFCPVASPIPFHARDYDITFCGTLWDPEAVKNHWKNFNKTSQALCESVVELLLSDNRKSLMEALEEALRYYGVISLSSVGGSCHNLINIVSTYVRGYRRTALLKELAQAGLKIHCFGHKETLGRINNPNLVIHDYLPARKYLEVLGRSKIVLNTTPNGKHSITERMLSTMMNGAVAATDTNDYIEQCFTDRCIIGFSHKDYKTLADKLSYLLASPQKLEEIARNGEDAAKKSHTVRHRAADLIAVAETGGLLMS